MKGLRAAVASLSLLSAASPVHAQEPAPPVEEPLDPDRPDVTNGTHIVGTGQVQIELGGQYAHTGPGERAFGSPFTARFGLADWLEVRFGTDGVLSQANGDRRTTGVGNVQLGAKIRLWADPGGAPVLSVLPTVNLPTASAEKGLGSGIADFTVAFLTGTDVGNRGHVDVNYGIGAIGAGNGRPRFMQHLLSLSASVTAKEHWNPYAEVFWFSRQDVNRGAATAIDGGAIYRLSPRLAIDGGVQFGLTDDAPDTAIFAGISVLVGASGDGVHQRHRRAEGRPTGRGTSRRH